MDNAQANLRAKMLLQRQKTLDKQKKANSMDNMVMTNSGMPVSEVSTPTGARARTLGGSSMSLGGASPTGLGLGSDQRPLLGATWGSDVGKEDSDKEERKAPAAPEPPISKEEEDKRRSELQQRLNDIGICPVFDPQPSVDASKPSLPFNLAALGPAEMRAFLHNPTPREAGMMQCRIVRDRGGLNKLYPKYRMETDDGIFLMTAQKQKHNKTSNYSVSKSPNSLGKDSEDFLGKLRSDFMGLAFVAYGPGLNPEKVDKKMSQAQALGLVREELAAVTYSAALWSAKPRGPRQMTVVVPQVQPSGERLVCRTLRPDAEGLIAMHKGAGSGQLIDTYHNKAPKWNEQIGAYVLNFNKRVTQASVKNFQLVHQEDPDTIFLQFGRVEKEAFNIDFRFPISPFQAFSICLSSFDYKICCE